MRAVPQIGVDFVAREEDFKPRPYQDIAGNWTNGFGNTQGVTAHTPPVTLSEAKAQLGRNMVGAASHLALCLPPATLDGLNDNQYAALLSFAYNTGGGPIPGNRAKAQPWAIWAAVPHGDMAVAAQLLRFVHAGDPPVVVDGLVNRRNAEIALYEGRDPLCKAEGAQA